MNCSADAKTIYAIYSNNYQSSSQEPRRVHSPLPRTTLSTDHCTMELQVFVQFIQFFLAYLYLSEYLKCPFPQGTRNPSLTSQVWFTSQFRSVICIWLDFGSVVQIDYEGNSDKTGDSILPPPYSPPSQPSVYDPNAADELNDWDERNNWDVNTGVSNFSEIYISALFIPFSRNCFLHCDVWSPFLGDLRILYIWA